MLVRTIAKLGTWENRKAKGRKQRNEQRARVIFYRVAERHPPQTIISQLWQGESFKSSFCPILSLPLFHQYCLLVDF